MKIEGTNDTERSRLFGRHFDHTDNLVRVGWGGVALHSCNLFSCSPQQFRSIPATSPHSDFSVFSPPFPFPLPLTLQVSRISRESINALKACFADEMTKDDWRLVIKLKKTFRID